MAESNFDQIFPLGKPNYAFAQYFIGQSYLAPLTDGSVPAWQSTRNWSNAWNTAIYPSKNRWLHLNAE